MLMGSLRDRQPAIVDIQILRAGQLVILCVPGEFTTMAGRRIKAAIYDQVGSPCGVSIRWCIRNDVPCARPV